MKSEARGCAGASVLIISALFSIPAFTQTTTFEQRRQDYIANSSGNSRCGHDIWGYLERNDQSQRSRISAVLSGWISPPIESGCWEFSYGANQLYLTRALRQYGDRLEASDKRKIDNYLDWYGPLNEFSHGTTNSQIMVMVAHYLWAQDHPSAAVGYGGCTNCGNDITFTWRGKTYKEGGTYNLLELSEAWLNFIFDRWINADDPHGELEGDYTRTFIIALQALYDFANDSRMRTQAKMMLDFILIESIMDTSVGLWGGHQGRTYGWSTLRGGPEIFWYPYWGIGRTGISDDVLAYVSSYRLPPLIEDLGLHQDEPEEYWHVNMEHRPYGSASEKITLVSKHYNLGGSSHMWQGSMGSPIPNADRIRFWINDRATILQPTQGEEYYLVTSFVGKGNYQYRNAMYVEVNNPTLFVVISNAFDQGAEQLEEVNDSIIGRYWRLRNGRGWYFFKEGKAMLGIQLSSSGAGLEFGIEGVDGSFSEFQNHLKSKAGLVDGGFKTSNGDVIGSRHTGQYFVTTVNGKEAYKLPFDRIEAIDNTGGKIVDWNNKVMTVTRHGWQSIYNFSNWTYSEEGSMVSRDLQPPVSPTNVKVGPGN